MYTVGAADDSRFRRCEEVMVSKIKSPREKKARVSNETDVTLTEKTPWPAGGAFAVVNSAATWENAAP